MLAAESFVRSGKVRDLYDLGDGRLLLVASDRVSAFDVVLPTGVPDKGRVLTGLSRFWFERTASILPNHLLSADPRDVPDARRPGRVDELRGRSMVCRQAAVLPVEVVVRGYLSGSGWTAYREDGSICGVPLPRGLVESDRLPEPVLTPSTKAPVGEHDIAIDFESMVQLLADWPPNGADWLGEAAARALAIRVREAALRLFEAGSRACEAAGLILADTKFEMGLIGGELVLVDEVLTPDSSRFWDAASYAPGGPQASFDKQPLRDWLEGLGWDKRPPGPELPPEVVAATRERYVAAFERITGASFERYLQEDVIAPWRRPDGGDRPMEETDRWRRPTDERGRPMSEAAP
ncbi:MAG TPA: phosphoribosylaminoimidazolesuccinocarboxamide synthase [Candidatus Binatia bacterium]|nr:phosphoribosylaminoimidazolesuccinocarboxamide synthase [Candidatus Binatia bacterium]